MLHRVRKEQDINKDKWIGIGGHVEGTESPDECLLREVKEETGLTLTGFRFRGLVTFLCGEAYEYMCLYTADSFTGEPGECDEGVLEWVPKEAVYDLNLWAGDKLFFRLLEEERPFFSLKLTYEPDGTLTEAVLDGKKLELLTILRDQEDARYGFYGPEEKAPEALSVLERDTAHRLGLLHATVHTWVVRQDMSGGWEVLCQKRSLDKDSNPGCWDLSSAGHISVGDTREEAVVRELREELGIEAKPEELEYLGKTENGIHYQFLQGEAAGLGDLEVPFVAKYQIENSALAVLAMLTLGSENEIEINKIIELWKYRHNVPDDNIRG